MRSIAIAVIGLALASLALACGESRQDKFEKAMRAAEVARTGLDSARDEYGKREAAYQEARAAADEAEAELGTARQKLDAATATWDASRVEVARWADDASVSRVLQQALLDEPGLATAALSARVEQGVALLEGTVPNDAVRERAVAIARGTPGVADVQSRITVAAGAPAPPAAAAPEATAPAESAPAEPSAEHRE